VTFYQKKNFEPDLTLTAQTVAYLEVSANEAERLSEMPTVVTNYAYKKLDGTYILPPMLYPDGKYYLKLGHHNAFERILHTPEQMESWYIDGKGDPEAVDNLASFITEQFIPSLKVLSVHGGCCVTAKTHDKKAPYVDEITPGVILAGGGCGYAAKSCDEIGRIAAKLCTKGEWTCKNIARSDMKIKWRNIKS